MYGTSPKSSICFCLLLVAAARAATSTKSEPVPPCHGNSSLPCLTNKLISAVRRINSIPEIPLTEWMSLVPSQDVLDRANEIELPEAESRNQGDHKYGMLQSLATAVDDFINSRNIRFALPAWASGSPRSLDVDLNRAYSEATGRGKKKGKMNMTMICMMVVGKLMMMGMGMVQMKAMKAMMMGSIALILSKIQLFKMMMGKKDQDWTYAELGAVRHAITGETKHVVVVTSGGHGHSPPSDSYGPPSNGWSSGGGGGGGYGGGGGWSSGGGGGGGYGGGGGDSWGGGGGGGGHGGGWGRRAYEYQTPEPMPIQHQYEMTPPPNR